MEQSSIPGNQEDQGEMKLTECKTQCYWLELALLKKSCLPWHPSFLYVTEKLESMFLARCNDK